MYLITAEVCMHVPHHSRGGYACTCTLSQQRCVCMYLITAEVGMHVHVPHHSRGVYTCTSSQQRCVCMYLITAKVCIHVHVPHYSRGMYACTSSQQRCVLHHSRGVYACTSSQQRCVCMYLITAEVCMHVPMHESASSWSIFYFGTIICFLFRVKYMKIEGEVKSVKLTMTVPT